MHDSNPRSQVETAPASPQRLDAAAKLRSLNNRFAARDLPDDDLAELSATVKRGLDLLEAGRERMRPIDRALAKAFLKAPPEGTRLVHQNDCPGCGPASPIGLLMDVHQEGDSVIGRATFRAAAAGAPGRAHGGFVAMAMDDLMGHILVLQGVTAYTARLELDYLERAPLDVPLSFRAWLAERHGRKIWVKSECSNGDRPVVSATGLFITVDPSQFAGEWT